MNFNGIAGAAQNLGGHDLFKIVDALVEGGATTEQIVEATLAVYNSEAEDLRPLLRAVPQIIGTIAKDAGPVVGTVIAVVASLMEDPEVKKGLGRMAVARATGRHAAYTAYTNAGFSAEQAMHLLSIDAQRSSGLPNAIASSLKGVVELVVDARTSKKAPARRSRKKSASK